MSVQELINEAIQAKLYEVVDSKENGLADCTITEIVDAVARGVAEALQ